MRIWCSDRWPWLLALLPALLFVPMVLAPPLNQDVAGVLQFSQRWLEGERLYVDIVDVNPPLIFVLNLIPAAIAAWTHVSAVLALQLCLITLGAACCWLAWRVRDRAAEGPVERVFLDVLPALFLFAPGYDFGQREHLMAMVALPYALAAARRAEGTVPRTRIAIAVLAGIGFALKPHFLAIPALLEAYVLWARWPRDKWHALRDPMPWIMAALWAVYLAALPLLFPAYLGSVLPLVWDVYIDLGSTSVAQVLVTQRIGTVICLLVPLLVVTWRSAGRLPPVLGLAALGALAAALVQHKGWSYHVMPVQLFACALGGVLAARWLDRRPGVAPAGAAALAGLFALYAIANGEAPWRELTYRQSEAAALTNLLERASGDRVLVLSPDVWPIYPALNYAGAQSTLPAMSTWLLQGSYASCPASGHRYRAPKEMTPAEATLFQEVVEEFAKDPPPAVLVDSNAGVPWCDGAPFDFIGYLSQDRRFAQAWSRYRMAGEWSHYRLFTWRGEQPVASIAPAG